MSKSSLLSWNPSNWTKQDTSQPEYKITLTQSQFLKMDSIVTLLPYYKQFHSLYAESETARWACLAEVEGKELELKQQSLIITSSYNEINNLAQKNQQLSLQVFPIREENKELRKRNKGLTTGLIVLGVVTIVASGVIIGLAVQ